MPWKAQQASLLPETTLAPRGAEGRLAGMKPHLEPPLPPRGSERRWRRRRKRRPRDPPLLLRTAQRASLLPETPLAPRGAEGRLAGMKPHLEPPLPPRGSERRWQRRRKRRLKDLPPLPWTAQWASLLPETTLAPRGAEGRLAAMTPRLEPPLPPRGHERRWQRRRKRRLKDPPPLLRTAQRISPRSLGTFAPRGVVGRLGGPAKPREPAGGEREEEFGQTHGMSKGGWVLCGSGSVRGLDSSSLVTHLLAASALLRGALLGRGLRGPEVGRRGTGR